MFAYCSNSPVCYDDPTGTRANGPTYMFVNDGGSGPSGSNNSLAEDGYEDVLDFSMSSSHDLNKRPYTGDPNSTYQAPNGDWRKYGPDGIPVQDYDHDSHGTPQNHPQDENGGHYHDWNNGIRGPAYLFDWKPIAGVGLIIVCVIGVGAVAVDDVTGFGVADDYLFGPLGAGIEKGIEMIIW